jgi:hypothetical protein
MVMLISGFRFSSEAQDRVQIGLRTDIGTHARTALHLGLAAEAEAGAAAHRTGGGRRT